MYLVKLGPHDVWYLFVMIDAWMYLKRFIESDTYTRCGNAPVRQKNLWFDECVVYYTYFCGWKFEKSRIELQFNLGAQYYWGRWDRFQKFGPLGQTTFVLPGEEENFTKSVKDILYENWKKFLGILKNIGVKLAWSTFEFEEGFWGTSSGCWEIWFSILPRSTKKNSPKLLWNFLKISSKSPGVFSTIFSKLSKILRNYSKISS